MTIVAIISGGMVNTMDCVFDVNRIIIIAFFLLSLILFPSILRELRKQYFDISVRLLVFSLLLVFDKRTHNTDAHEKNGPGENALCKVY